MRNRIGRRSNELGRLEELHRRGLANDVPGLRRINGAEIPDVEPQARGVAALHAPNTGIVNYGQVARKMSAELRAAGVRVELGTEVTGFGRESGSQPRAAPRIGTAENWGPS